MPNIDTVPTIVLASLARRGRRIAKGALLVAIIPLQFVVGMTAGSAEERSVVKINIRIEDRVLRATLDDSAAAKDFASLLPLTLTLKDYASTEKIADLPRRLATDDAPAGIDPATGDIAYYAPWGNLAIFYKDFGYSSGLVRLGRIDSGIEDLARSGAVTATIERAQ